jgi:hypothetical protein
VSLQTRAEQLHAEIEARHGKGDLLFVAVICDTCGSYVEAESVLKLLPEIEGWQLGRYGESADFCPGCQ